jgi:hypothetical protein
MSMVIALGLTEITVSWGRLLQRRHEVRFHWLHAFWSLFAVFLMIQFWWGFWNFRVVEDWTLASLLAVVAETITLVLCALQLVPRRSAAGAIDLEELYFSNARTFFVLAVILMLQFCAWDTVVLGIPVFHSENLIRFSAAIVCGFMAWNLNPRLHKLMPVATAVLMGLFLSKAYML